jgi:toxin ParE1/3/4
MPVSGWRARKRPLAVTKLIWSNLARADLLEIYTLIGLEQPAAAERYFDRIEAKVSLLKSQPRMGVRRPDIRGSMRMLIEAPYLLLYRTEPDADEGPIESVEIIRVVDGRRDLRSIF